MSTPCEPGHLYISTACFHEECDSCRRTCKFCDSRCRCGCHQGSKAEVAVSWVDQARDMARMLLMEVRDAGGPWTPQFAERIASDPDLFWLRGQEQPPGV